MKTIVCFLFLLFGVSFAKSEIQTIKIPGYDGNLRTIKAINNLVFVAGSNGKIYRSSNSGQSWVETPSVTTLMINSFEFINESIGYAVGKNGVFLKTVNSGNTWTVLQSFTSTTLQKIYCENNNFYAAGNFGTFYKSTNFGATWLNRSIPNFNDPFVDIFFRNNQGRMVNSHDSLAFWTSSNNGESWVSSVLPGRTKGLAMYFPSLSVGYIAGIIYENGNPIIAKTENNGVNWVISQLEPGVYLEGISFIGNTGYCIGSLSSPVVRSRIYKTTDGNSWQTEVEFDGREMFSICTTDNFCFVSGDSGLIYRLEVPVGISPINSEVPTGFALSQNYPNPFNPSTKINFSIPKSGKVKLSVFNTVGKEEKVLYNQSFPAGNYTADFDASNLTSGVYFYTLRSENFQETKRMVLVK